jgi:hypothetical protein
MAIDKKSCLKRAANMPRRRIMRFEDQVFSCRLAVSLKQSTAAVVVPCGDIHSLDEREENHDARG